MNSELIKTLLIFVLIGIIVGFVIFLAVENATDCSIMDIATGVSDIVKDAQRP